MKGTSKSRIGAIVLLAGMSTRMGKPKQLLRFGGKTLLEQMLKNVQRARVDQIILVLGFAAHAIERHGMAKGLKIVFNREYSLGMRQSGRPGARKANPRRKRRSSIACICFVS